MTRQMTSLMCTRREILLLLVFVLCTSIGFGQESESDEEDAKILKEMSDYPSFVKSTRKRFDDFMEKYEGDNAVDDDDDDANEEDTVNDAWEDSSKQVDPQYAPFSSTKKEYDKYLNTLYQKFMATGETPSGKKGDQNLGATWPSQPWFPLLMVARCSLELRVLFRKIVCSRAGIRLVFG